MIELKTLAAAIEAGLNENTRGLAFKIHADGGRNREKQWYTEKNYIHGILQVVSSTVVPAQSLSVATQSARLEIVAPYGFGDPEPVLNTIRTVLDGYFQSSTVQVMPDANGKRYTVGVNYALADTGTLDIRPQVGPSITFVVTISYSFIQNGLNSMNCSFTLDGHPLAYTSATISRVPVMDGNAYSDTNGGAKNIALSSALSFDLKVPAVEATDPAGKIIIDYILSGELNAPHTLEVDLGGEKQTYTVLFGQTDVALDGVQNAGHSISFVEAAEAV